MADGSNNEKNDGLESKPVGKAFDMSELSDTLPKSDEQLLKSFTLEEIGNLIKEKKVKNIITMVGAGISTAAGIPDFRSPDTGLYANLQKYNLPNPLAIFSIDYFRENPKPFFELAKEFQPGSYKPTLTHFFIRKLHDEGLLLRHFTQNIDCLERDAGIPEDKLVEAHGTFATSRCIDCSKEHDIEHVKKAISQDDIPKCTESGCTGVVKPDIVFFGEALPSRFRDKVNEDFPQCDMLIILGTSLVVLPFSFLAYQVRPDVPRLYVTKIVGNEERDTLDYGTSENTRDVFVNGDCDENCMKLAKLLGWDKTIETLYKEAQNSKSNSGTSSKGSPNNESGPSQDNKS